MDFLSPFAKPLVNAVFGWLPGGIRWAKARFGSWMPLSDAARQTYQEARRIGSIVADAAERLGPDKSPEGILNYIAAYIALNVPVWGTRLPSTKREQIDSVQARTGAFRDGATTFRPRGNPQTVFTDLCIARKDMQRLMDDVRSSLKVDTAI